eukprot:5522094-Lingulodinium_polyedra.AAC.1
MHADRRVGPRWSEDQALRVPAAAHHVRERKLLRLQAEAKGQVIVQAIAEAASAARGQHEHRGRSPSS